MGHTGVPRVNLRMPVGKLHRPLDDRRDTVLSAGNDVCKFRFSLPPGFLPGE